ncbi:phage holin family protein [Mycoplasma sp. 'Moose RK']|uniref:phage holin family protein n=1 Tax=Mycoplasma sp. 'Moose RK' TaxID=2780095 RepID=UPI0018C23F6E|nr:phage holin family protein [Mycoplasma sp. 'Moose RK']MBG0730627.1 phage holin family protein [Mycoplasma sp. 'Moose RK']
MNFDSYKRTSASKLKQIKKTNIIFLILAIVFFLFFVGLLAFYLVQLSGQGFSNDFIEATWLVVSLFCMVLTIVFLISFLIGIYKIKNMKKLERNIENQLRELP